MRRVLLIVAVCWVFASTASANEGAYVHTVREGETIASIAERYYGDPRRETVLVKENGLTANGGSDIVVGMRLVIPWVRHHVVQAEQTWTSLARTFYGDQRRAFILIQANKGSSSTQPDEGVELIIPYPLRHVVSQNETIRRLSAVYYGKKDKGGRTIRKFNRLRGNRLVRGSVILVPLGGLTLSEEGRKFVEQRLKRPLKGGERRAVQVRAGEQLPELVELVRRGKYVEAVALGNRLTGIGDLTSSQLVTIHRALGTAYVALGRRSLAVDSFKKVLERAPTLEFGRDLTSPAVLDAVSTAKKALRQSQPSKE